jgi:isopentenyl-diphosphate delta-isomerase
MTKVILVDEHDREIGHMEKLEAHQKGLLHRAVSVLIFNADGQWLLQQRADNKYHSPGLWSNTCCSHPAPGEITLKAAERRLHEEMGIKTNLNKEFDFIYKIDFENGLTEYELDHVYSAVCNDNPILNSEEAKGYCWVNESDLKIDINNNPEKYTFWFRKIVEKIRS